MPERVAIVGSRRAADLDHVERVVRALYAQQPDTILISGGAEGVDKTAEALWLQLGGRVVSFRVRQEGDRVHGKHHYAVEVWELGVPNPRTYVLTGHPTWATRESALFYRDSLIAEHAQRVVAFYRSTKSAGTATTVDFAHAYGRPTHEFLAEAA